MASVPDNSPPSDDAVPVLYAVADQVATITLNRPDRQNTISGPMLDTLTEYLLEADADREVRAIVIAGSGRFFCAGLDLRGGGIASNLGDDDAPPSTNLDLRNTPPTVLHHLDTPTICALNGSAAGYGMDLALGCDLRIAGESARLAAAFREEAERLFTRSGRTVPSSRVSSVPTAARKPFSAARRWKRTEP